MVYTENSMYTAVRQHALHHCMRSSPEAMTLPNRGVLSAAPCTMRNISYISCTEKQNTQNLCSITFFKKNRAIYEIMWKNTVERDRPQMATWRMRIAFWIIKATNTLSKYDTLLFHRNNGCTNWPHCSVIHKLPVLLHGISPKSEKKNVELNSNLCVS